MEEIGLGRLEELLELLGDHRPSSLNIYWYLGTEYEYPWGGADMSDFLIEASLYVGDSTKGKTVKGTSIAEIFEELKKLL